MEKQEVWRNRVLECESSELSIGQWCRENNINKNTLNYWRARFKKDNNTVVFAKLEESSERPTSTINVWIGQVRIEVSNDIDFDLFNKIIRAISC